jgi:hypothetical protein
VYDGHGEHMQQQQQHVLRMHSQASLM